MITNRDFFQYVYQCLPAELQDKFSKDDVLTDLADWSYKKITAFD
jgi:hypothetical protein